MAARNQKELGEQLAELAEALGAKITFPNGEGGGSAWAKKPEAAMTGFLGVSVPIKVQTPRGSVRAYISLPPEVLATPEGFLDAIGRLIDMGIPVDIYENRGGGEGGGWKGNNGGGQSRPFNGGGGGGGGYGGGQRRW